MAARVGRPLFNQFRRVNGPYHENYVCSASEAQTHRLACRGSAVQRRNMSSVEAPGVCWSCRLRTRRHHIFCYSCHITHNGGSDWPTAITFEASSRRYSSQEAPRMCWSCRSGTTRHNLFCRSCKVVQPMSENTSYFEMLCNSKVQFDVNLSDVRQRYLELQQALHPDRFSKNDSKEHAHAEAASSFVNKAYNTIKDPLTRAIYMLHLQGVDVSSESKSSSAYSSEDDTEFLMEVMEQRERLEEAQTPDDLNEIKHDNDRRMEAELDVISHAFKTNDLSVARKAVVRLRYWRSLSHALDDRIAATYELGAQS